MDRTDWPDQLNRESMAGPARLYIQDDTLYMTGNFEEFKMNDHFNGTWDEQNALASTVVRNYTLSWIS